MRTHHLSCFPTPQARRSRLTWLAVALVLAVAGPVSALPAIKTYATLSLKDGRLLTEVEVINYTATDVLVRHLGGATSLPTDLLPSTVLVDLHLPAPASARAAELDPSLADKVAVAGPTFGVNPAPGAASAVADQGDSNVTAEQLQAAAQPVASNAAAPAGEGNLGEFVPSPSALFTPAQHGWTTLAGRIAVTLPGGETHFLGDVEVRAYPAELLARGLVQAQAQAGAVAQQLRDQAAVALQEGRSADAAALSLRADRTVERYLDLLPLAPYVARSDSHGHFTLRHDLAEMRLVAAGRVNVASGEWTYAWVGVVPGPESLLTEANATAVSSPAPGGPRFAAR